MARQSPPPSVLEAFNVSGPAVRLEGGQGSSWSVGDAVIKPLDLSEEALAWQAEAFASISCDGFRVSRPLRAEDGLLVVDGWCAWEAVEGRHEERRWPEIIAVGERFHAALAGVPRPDFIALRTGPWAIGDRVAWGELPASEFAHVKHLTRLASALRPVVARTSSSMATSRAMCCSTTGFHQRSSTSLPTGGLPPLPRRSWSATPSSGKTRTKASYTPLPTSKTSTNISCGR